MHHKKDIETAKCNLQKAIEKGCVDAIITNAKYLNSDKEKYKMYKKYAIKRNASAQYQLSVCYERGIGTEKDNDKFMKWLKASAEKHYPDALYKLGNIFMKWEEYTKAFGCFVEAAINGSSRAKFMVAVCLDDGLGTIVNKRKAYKMYGELALNGDMDALYNIAVSLENGDGVEKKPQYAKELFDIYNRKCITEEDKKIIGNIIKL
jgi:TPR repeat protein